MRHLIDSDRLEWLKTGAGGLDEAQASARSAEIGRNDIVGEEAPGWQTLVADTARDPMIWFLVVAASLFALIGDRVEAVVLGLAMIPIIGMDFYLHRRTRMSRAGLADRLAETALVCRDGRMQKVPAASLVPGDLVQVDPVLGFPADGILIEADDLQVDESMLSGESLPLRKQAMAQPPSGDAVEHAHWGVAGTRLLNGKGRLLVVHTGQESLYGQIVRLALATAHAPTPLQRAVAGLVRILLTAAVILCLALAATRYWQGHGLVDALISAVVLAVAALPEEFPVVLAFFLGVGVFRLARSKALVRRAVVVELIGRASCICTDKTGTLTEGRFRLEHFVPIDDSRLEPLRQAASMASRGESGDPIDLAIGETCSAARGERLATFAFTEERRFEAGIWRQNDGSILAAVKGAPETILAMCRLADGQRQEWERKAGSLADSGHRVIACATRALPAWDGVEPVADHVLLGLLAFEDPLRSGVADSMRRARQAGIRVIMMTGDHPGAALAIAEQAGLCDSKKNGLMLGDELNAALASGETAALDDVRVIARCLPAQKLALVEALRRQGETVAVTGDGVNDVPALKAADIGIAMGERGTRPAREAAAIVLQDDNFATIINAVAEGRQLFINLKQSFAYLLLIHIPLVSTAALIPFAGFPLLYLPIHIVWLELIIHPTALLAFQSPADEDRMRAPPDRSPARLFGTAEWRRILGGGLLLTIVVIAAYLLGLSETHDAERGRSLALAFLIMSSAGLAAGLSRLRTRAARWVVVLSLLSVALMQWPQSADLLHVKPMNWPSLGLSLAVGLVCAIWSRRLR